MSIRINRARDALLTDYAVGMLKDFYMLESESSPQEAYKRASIAWSKYKGEFDEDGFLKITGRTKEMFKTSGGKYVVPPLLEGELKQSLFIEQVMVIGEGEKMPAALIQPNFEFIKEWIDHPNKTLSTLCNWMINRRLYKTEISQEPYSVEKINSLEAKTVQQLQIPEKDLKFFVFSANIQNNAYNPEQDRISVFYKNGETKDIAEASDQLNISSLSTPVTKYFLCYPKTLTL